MAEQTILFTIMPRGISVDRDTLPVSVYVSPRLGGADTLDAFPDWLQWTPHIREQGLTLVIQCNDQQTHEAEIDREVLRPELWEQLFKPDTLVRPYPTDDYRDRGIISYSVRQSLSALKSIYQEASVTLALPDSPREGQDDRRGKRDLLRDLVNGLEVHWNGRRAKEWRAAVRRQNLGNVGLRSALAQTPLSGPLDGEGLIVAERSPSALKQIAVPFAVFHHMPTPEHDDLKIDPDTLLDFHQALSSLNSYPELLRALGLVFDLELPRDFVAETIGSQYGRLSVAKVGFDWRLRTRTPALETAYLNLALGGGRLFCTAPRALAEAGPPMNVIGLLDLDPQRFGLAQVDVDGGMHKTIMLAESLNTNDPQRNLNPNAEPEPAAHPEVFDPEATLPALRSGGLTLFADRRALHMLDSLRQSQQFQQDLTSGQQKRPFFAEDLLRGYRLDIWDSRTTAWHSLHQRAGKYRIGDLDFATEAEEGFSQLAAMQPAPGADPDDKDFYLHEAIARWAGWSLSAPRPGKHLSRHADPSKAVPPDGDDPEYAEDQPETPFKLSVSYQVLPGSLPRLRFGACYRLRARAVDLAGNSLRHDEPLAALLARAFGLPRDLEGLAYLRYEPVPAPLVVPRDPAALTGPGSAIDRLVIRTQNDGIANDGAAADTTAADRHILPPRTSVEMGERLGMFDDANGVLQSDPATWQLIGQRDAGELHQSEPIEVAGQSKTFPLEPDATLAVLPYLPDPLAHGAALRDLPGSLEGGVGSATPGVGAAGSVEYTALSDPNPRPGSATLISFGESGDWQQTLGFRLALAEPTVGQTDTRPHWDPDQRVLTIFLPKGHTRVVPLTSQITPEDLKRMGIWQWLREYIERVTITDPRPQYLQPGAAVDEIAHVLQRAVEGGHWMLTPPRLLTLVHAVQQPIGEPAFSALQADHIVQAWDPSPLQTAPIAGRADPTELAPLTAWRRPGATDAYLIGALKLHGASTDKIDLTATWTDPVDDPNEPTWRLAERAAQVDQMPLPSVREGYLRAPGVEFRRVGYYDPEHDQIGFVRTGDQSGALGQGGFTFSQAAPRHLLNDTRHHRISYTATATSRYREYFPQDQDLDFTRSSAPLVVDVPASERPLAPSPVYILPTFGWQRQTDTNLMRSVRFGGGLRVYLNRPWFSSGEGELLGVALYSYQNGALNADSRDKFKPFISQWGMDPIWQTGGLSGIPAVYNFADAEASEYGLSLEEATARVGDQPGRVDVAGFPVAFDEERGLWYADLTINTFTTTYMPFVRLALVRYQPHALADAKISRAVVADWAQLTPDRSAMVTADPQHPRRLRVVVSGVAPRGPQARVRGEPRPTTVSPRPTRVRVRVQQHNPAIPGDLGWADAPNSIATVSAAFDDHLADQPDLALWAGSVTFEQPPEPGRYRLLIEEHEYISANYTIARGRVAEQPGRLIYAEIFPIG